MLQLRSWDGINLAYYEWNADAPGTPVVLHHGFVANADVNWVRPGVVDALCQAGRRVVALDARGHGRSDKPHDPESYGEVNMSRDVQALFDHLDAPEYDLVGYSMGAVVALITASRERRVRRLAVGGVGCAVVELGGVDSRVLPTGLLADALLAVDGSRVEHPAARGFRAFAEAMGSDLRALAAQARSAHQSPIALDAITAPTLVLAGEDDALAARPQVLVDAIADARLQLVPGDHMSATGQRGFAASLVAFLAG